VILGISIILALALVVKAGMTVNYYFYGEGFRIGKSKATTTHKRKKRK
jgi:hypothetical protein